MGVDCFALVGMRERPVDTERILRELNALNPEIADWWPSALPGYRTRYNPDVDQAWRVMHNQPGEDVISLAGSRSLTLQVYGRAVIHLAEPRWQTFLTVPAQREFVRRVCRAFASLFGGDRVIYVPDGSCSAGEAAAVVRQGGSVEMAEAWLLQTCGPPVLEWDRFAATPDPLNHSNYCVDRLGSGSERKTVSESSPTKPS